MKNEEFRAFKVHLAKLLGALMGSFPPITHSTGHHNYLAQAAVDTPEFPPVRRVLAYLYTYVILALFAVNT